VRDGVNGVLVSPAAGIEAWADAIEGLLDDAGKSAAMGHAGRKLVEAEFSDSRVCAETLALYQQAINDIPACGTV